MSLAAPNLADFSPSRQFLATITGSTTLKVWDTRQGKLLNEYRPSDHLAIEFTSLAWTTTSKPQTVSSAEQDSLVALGTSSGNIIVWNIVTAEVQLEIKKKNACIQGCIRHLAINSAQTSLFACSESSRIVEYSLQTGKELRVLRPAADSTSVSSGYSRLALSPDAKKLLSADTRILLWDLTQGVQIAEFVGHASPLRDLAFLPSGKYFVSADSDKFINVWSARSSGGHAPNSRTLKRYHKARVKLIASADIQGVHVQEPMRPAATRSNSCDVCCLCRNGDVDIWRIDAKKGKSDVPQQAHARISCDHSVSDTGGVTAGTSSDTGMDTSIADVGAIFAIGAGVSRTLQSDASQASSTVICARGSALQPHFETASLESSNGSLESTTLEFLDTRALLKALRQGSSTTHNDGVGSTASTQRSAHVLGARDSTASITGQKRRLSQISFEKDVPADENTKSRKETKLSETTSLATSIETTPDAETLEERLDNLRHFTETPADTVTTMSAFDGSGADFGGNGTQSLVTILQQALQANDRAKLEYCLAVHDKEIVTTTINKLPAACILPFLQQLVDRLEKSPRRGRVLVGWIRKILMRHTAYLMTVPDLATELAALYEIIASRSALYTKFCRLSGRVDVLLAQLTARKSLQLAEKQKPVEYYDVSEDDEDEADDGEESDSEDSGEGIAQISDGSNGESSDESDESSDSDHEDGGS